MEEPNDNTNFKFSQEYSVAAPRPKHAYLVPVSDWERLKRLICRIAPPKNWFQIGGSLVAGISVTSLVGIWQSDNPSFHFTVVAWTVAASGAILAIALFYLDGQQRQDITQSAKSVTDEMLEMEKTFTAQADAAVAAQESR